MKNILFLYRELAGYVVVCLEHFAAKHAVSIDVVAYPVNPEAPFQFQFSENIRVHDRTKMSDEALLAMAHSKMYSLIFCGGWIDAAYLHIVKTKSSVPSLIAFDKQWTGSIRDRLAAAFLKWKVRPHFDYAFVAGKEQSRFAAQMGFSSKEIYEGVYAADVSRYSVVFDNRRMSENPKKYRNIWYAGRYIQQKGFNDLFSVFADLADNELSNWKLHAVGTGDQWEKRIQHPHIVHHGFIQPSDMLVLMQEGGIFVLPSLFEPWGVVVHEFAAAGFPLLLSDKVGARTAFLKENKNGRMFKAGHREDLKKALLQLTSISDDERQRMGEMSHHLAMQITPETWAQQVLSMMTQP